MRVIRFNKKKVKWDDENGISLKTHSDYVENFAQTFYDQVKILIDKNQQNKLSDLNEKDSNLLREVLDHAYFCNETAAKFHGRQDLLLEVIF